MAWDQHGSIRGPAGEPGPAGDPGPQGDPGAPGADSTVPGPPGADLTHSTPQPVVAVTAATFTPTVTHAGARVEVDRASAVTVTLPTHAAQPIPINTRIDFLIVNTGMATFVGAGGVTVNGAPSLVTRAQWTAVTVIKRSTTAWVVVGGLA